MNRHIGARWFSRRPLWMQNLVYRLTGWHVVWVWRTYRSDLGLFAISAKHKVYQWTRFPREYCRHD